MNEDSKVTTKFVNSVSLKSSMNSRDHSRNQTVVLKVQEKSDHFFIIFRKVDVEIIENNNETIKPRIISGIQIYICHSLENISQIIPFAKIKDVVEKAFRLLVLSYHTSYDTLSKENKELYDEDNFVSIQSFLLKLGMGTSIEFVSYYNPSLKVSDPLAFQKELPSIFDEPEKSSFIHTGSEKIDIQGSFDEFILMFDRQNISGTVLKQLQEFLNQQSVIQRMNFQKFKESSINNQEINN